MLNRTLSGTQNILWPGNLRGNWFKGSSYINTDPLSGFLEPHKSGALPEFNLGGENFLGTPRQGDFKIYLGSQRSLNRENPKKTVSSKLGLGDRETGADSRASPGIYNPKKVLKKRWGKPLGGISPLKNEKYGKTPRGAVNPSALYTQKPQITAGRFFPRRRAGLLRLMRQIPLYRSCLGSH